MFNLTVTDAAGKTFKRRYSVNSSNTSWFMSNANPSDVWVGSGRRSLIALNIAGTNASRRWLDVRPRPRIESAAARH